MFTIKTNKKSTIVLANTFVPGAGYKRMLELAQAHKGTVDTDKKTKLAKITFGDKANAEKFVKAFTGEYAKAHKAYAKAPATKKTTTDGKGSRAKRNAFDFGKIKGKTNSDKNKALHKALVGMGITDSRTPEYMSVWNARPWAK